MILRGRGRNWAFGFAVSSTAWLSSARVEACSCAGGASVDWPVAGQTDVPRDTSIVVAGFGRFADAALRLVLPVPTDAGTPGPLPLDGGAADLAPLPPADELAHPAGLHLVSPDQHVIALMEQHTYPAVDCIFSYHFYGHEGALEANTTYRLYDGPDLVSTFTTGTQLRDRAVERAEARAMEFRTLGTTENPPRVTTAYVGKVPSTPTFLHYVGSNEEVTYRMYERADGVATYHFGALACPRVEVLGMDGESLDERTLCEPERCKPHPDAVGSSTCGGNYTVGVAYEEFLTLPACSDGGDGGSSAPSASALATSEPGGSHDSAPASTSEAVTFDEPGPNKVPLTSSKNGCAVGPGPAGNPSRITPWSWLLGVVAALSLAARSQRRRSQRRGASPFSRGVPASARRRRVLTCRRHDYGYHRGV